MTQRRDVLLPLTSLRFVAALLVFTWHCVPTRRVSVVFSLGYIGVAFFFLLSGFILTYTYHGAFRDRLRPDALRAFYVARLARVYPLHLAMMPPMIACLVYLGPNPLWSGVDAQTRLHAVAAQALLVQSWIPTTAIYFGVNGPAWSISVEAFFYAVFPIAAFLLLRAFRAAAPRVVLVCAGAVCAAQMALLWPQHATVDDWRWYVFPPARLVDFVVGMMVAIAYLRSGKHARGGKHTRAVLHPTSVELLAIAAVALAVYVSPFAPLSLRFSTWVMPAWGLLILIFAWQRGAVSHVLAHPVLVRLGEVSFAFYLCHIAVLSLLGRVLAAENPIFVPLALASTLLVSFALYHGVEHPMRGRVRALLAPRALRAQHLEHVPHAAQATLGSSAVLSAAGEA
jgi:peptidoglycan/LPS O-acetylase OafA/YrhL